LASDYTKPYYELLVVADSDEKIKKVSAHLFQVSKTPDIKARADFLSYIAGLPYEGADPEQASTWVRSQLELSWTGRPGTVIGKGSFVLWGTPDSPYLDITPGFAS